MKNIFLLICVLGIFISVESCKNTTKINMEKGFTKEGLRYEVQYLKKDSSINKMVGIYYKNSDSLCDAYFMKDDIKQGVEETYTFRGRIKERVFWSNGIKIRNLFFDTLKGIIDSERDFVLVNNACLPNTFFKFIPSHDTIKNESFYYSTFCNSNVIRDGETYVIAIILETPIFNQAYVVFSPYDTNFNRHIQYDNSTKYDSFKMKNFIIEFKSDKYKIGKNVVNGEIVNYGDLIDTNNKNYLVNTTGNKNEAHLFFSAEFYVAPDEASKKRWADSLSKQSP